MTMADQELEQLRADAESLGVDVDGRWGVERLRHEIAAAESDQGYDQPDDDQPQPEAHAEDQAPEPEAKRAGGWVNRNDGEGWVLEREG